MSKVKAARSTFLNEANTQQPLEFQTGTHAHIVLAIVTILILLFFIIINVKIIVTLSQKNAAGALYKALCKNLQLTLCNK